MSIVQRYHVRDGADLGHLLAEIERRLVLERESSRTSARVVYDTFDWRLFNEGTVFEVETEPEPNAVWRSFASGEVLGRFPGRLTPRFADDLPETPATARLADLIEMRALLPLATIISTRTVLRVLGDEAKTIGRVVVDEASLEGGPESRPALPAVIEVVSVRGYEKELAVVNDLLEAQVLLEPVTDDIAIQAVRAVGYRPGSYSSKLKLSLDPSVPAWQAWIEVLKVLHATMLENEAGVRDDTDSEFLHDYRVAVRRTRSVLGQAKGVLPPDALDEFRAEFAWLGGVTGPTRDFDVFLLSVPEFQAALPAERRQDLEPFRDFLVRQQEIAQRQLVAELDTERYATLLRRWAAFLDDPGLDDLDAEAVPLAHRPPASVVARRIHKAHRRLLRDGRSVHEGSEPEALHDLRKDAKKLRYLFECFGSLLDPDGVAAVVRDLKALQDVLGEYQDCQVQIGSLEEFGQQMLDQGGAPASALLAMGALVDQLAERERVARIGFHERFDAFDAKHVRKTVRQMVAAVSDDEGSVDRPDPIDVQEVPAP